MTEAEKKLLMDLITEHVQEFWNEHYTASASSSIPLAEVQDFFSQYTGLLDVNSYQFLRLSERIGIRSLLNQGVHVIHVTPKSAQSTAHHLLQCIYQIENPDQINTTASEKDDSEAHQFQHQQVASTESVRNSLRCRQGFPTCRYIVLWLMHPSGLIDHIIQYNNVFTLNPLGLRGLGQ